MDLESARRNIDYLDTQLIELVVQRFKLCQEIGGYKLKNNLEVQDKKRELRLIKDKIEKFKNLGLDDEKFVKELFELILKKSKELQSK